MNFKNKLKGYLEKADSKFTSHFGFRILDADWSKVCTYMHSPRDASSLAVTRILFGLAMLCDIPEERGGANMQTRWGNPRTCHFPLIPFIKAVPMPYMALVYSLLWLGALGIMLGYKYRASAIGFTVCYWYLFIIDKSYWNNHSYLFGLVGFLLSCTRANCYWSLDAHLDPSQRSETVPYWNYFILKYQFFILYFMAGVKKGTQEWLSGYSLPNLSEHWVFDPFKLFLSVSQTDYLIVHWFAFLFDLTVAFWMMLSRTRHLAMIFCAAFHLMNIRLFKIGMFPWVCLATMPLFYPFNWPKLVIRNIKNRLDSLLEFVWKPWNESDQDQVSDESEETYDNHVETTFTDKHELESESEYESPSEAKETKDIDNGKGKIIALIIVYVIIQAFLPFSHFITKGYNNWTNGLYGYSWDMMVHTWETNFIVVKLVDNDHNKTYYIEPFKWTPNDRWTRHGDMAHQYAHCLKENLMQEQKDYATYVPSIKGSDIKNVSIYVDVWYSMNGRFHQRIFDPKVDLLKADWSPFKEVSWLMPLLDEASSWRSVLDEIRKEVYSWSNNSDVIFAADFPGYHLENYMAHELSNVTLTILEGDAVYEPEATNVADGQSHRLQAGDHIPIPTGSYHKVINIGKKPAFYVYSFFNETETKAREPKPKLPITQEVARRINGMLLFFNTVASSIVKVFFRLSMWLIKYNLRASDG